MTDSEDEGQEDAKPEEKEAEPASPPVQSHEPVSPLAGGEPGIPQPQRTARSPSLFAHRHSMVGKRPLSPLVPRDSIVDVDYDAPPSPRSQAVDQAVVMDFDMHQLAMDVNLAARFGDVEQLKHLLLRGADLQVKDYDNRSPYVARHLPVHVLRCKPADGLCRSVLPVARDKSTDTIH
jgi:hypothetical protein